MPELDPTATEEWRQVPGYPDYEVSNFGKIRRHILSKKSGNTNPGRLLRPNTSRGYFGVRLYNGSLKKRITVHRAVAITFLDTYQSNLQVNHKDGNKLNNRLENLEWVTQKENAHHASMHGLLATGNMSGARLHPETRARGDRHGSKTHPERVACGNKNGARTHPERIARGDKSFSRMHPERLARGERHANSKLTELQVRIIRRIKEFFPEHSYGKISELFCVTKRQVINICQRKAWKHVP